MIRKAEVKDIEMIMRLLHQVNDLHAEGRPDLFRTGATKYTPKEIESVISDVSTPVFVLSDDDDRLLAYCFCIVQDHTNDQHLKPFRSLYIDDLCVDESARGRHIGSQLFEYVKGWAKSNGFHNITLNVWACNESAVRFYRSLGLLPQKTTLETIL